MSAYLEREDGRRASDDGDFKSYAGAVRAIAAGVCARWGGSVDAVSYDSPLGHCR